MEFVSTTVLSKVWISRFIKDPMLAKLITYGETREEVQIMLKAIDGYLVKGVEIHGSVNLCLNTKLFALGI
jgi:acetyl/propionyl-CoA carboxylase alpha subunit